MELPIINIGKSLGIILSQNILEKYKITDKIELILEEDYIILKPKREARKNWEKAFKKMHENGNDQLLMNSIFEDEIFEE